MKINRKIAMLLCLYLVMLSGCTEKQTGTDYENTSVVLSKSGALTYYLVDSFDKDYYEVSELADMAKQEVEEFNEFFEEAASPKSVELIQVNTLPENSSKVLVEYQFSGGDSFSRFMEGTFFYGTVADAYADGFQLKGVLQAVKGDDTLSDIELKQQSGKKLIITDLKIPVYCENKVLYVSSGVVINEDGSLDFTNVNGTAVIVMK